MTDTLVEPAPTDDDATYRRVVRSLYIIGLALNVWLIYEMVKDQPDFQIQLTKLKALWKRRVTDCEGCAKRKKKLRALINQTHWEAIQIVTEVEPHDAGD